MKIDVAVDLYWADLWTDDIRKIIKENAGELIEVEVAPFDDDAERATDFVIRVSSGDMAVRIRRSKYTFRDWTIRSRRVSGNKTELEKIREGFARWYLYVWKKHKDDSDYVLIDLDKVRESDILSRLDKYPERQNYDKQTSFIAIPITDLVEIGAVVASRL